MNVREIGMVNRMVLSLVFFVALMAVTAYLIKQGIDSDRLETKGYGSLDPIASNDTEEGRQKNRRVRFKRIK